MKPLQPSPVSSPSHAGGESAPAALPHPEPIGRRPRRRWRLVVAVSAAILAAGWSILWLFAADTTAGSLQKWVSQEQMLGRNWTCRDRTLGGFPFRIAITCAKPSFEGAVGGAEVTGKLGSLLATAEVYAPTDVAVAVSGPLELQSSNRQHLRATWTSLMIELGFTSNGFDRASVTADALRLDAEAPQVDDLSIDARKAEADFDTASRRSIKKAAYDFSVRIDDGRLRALDHLFDNDDPATIRATGLISHLDSVKGGNLGKAIEKWRAAGGAIDLVKARVQKGETEIEASGQLGLDARHRPRGRIELSGVGLAPLLARYGVPSAALAIDDLLSGLLASSRPAQAAAPAIRIPLRLQNGHVFVGPLRTPLNLPRLY